MNLDYIWTLTRNPLFIDIKYREHFFSITKNIRDMGSGFHYKLSED